MKTQVESQAGLEKEREEGGDVKYSKDEDEDEVTIVLARNKWNESLKAIENLMHFAQNQREKAKEKESENDILENIDMLFKHLFSSRQSNRNEKEEIDVYNEIQNMTSEEFDSILHQIENNNEYENKNNNNNDNNNNIIVH